MLVILELDYCDIHMGTSDCAVSLDSKMIHLALNVSPGSVRVEATGILDRQSI